MGQNPNYAELAAQAEKAVASVKDPELRKIAFQRVLDDLLKAELPIMKRGAKAVSRDRNVNIARQQVRKGGPKGLIEELIGEDFFGKPKTIGSVKAELENRGHHIVLTSLSGPLQSLCKEKKLRRQKLKASGKKQTFAYSNW